MNTYTAIYARISDDRRDGVGVDSQLETCRQWCAEEGWGPVREYVDNDVSASVYANKPRKDYQRLLRDVEAGELTRIVAFNTDRLFRQVRELEVLIPLAERVEVRSKVGGIFDLSTAGGRASARMQATWASFESEVKSERVRLSQQRARSDGELHGGPRPFGWQQVETGGRRPTWQHEPTEAALIRQAVDDVLAGARITDVARRWTAAGVPQPRGKHGWHPTSIRTMLTAPRNAGLLAHKGDVLGPGSWPAIVERAKWERVCAELERRRGGYTTLRRQRALLTGVLLCGRCGAGLSHGRTRGLIIYRCKMGQGQPGCGRVQIAAGPLERDLADRLIAYLDTADLGRLAAGSGDNEAVRAAAELAELERQAAETADLAAAGEIRPADFARYSTGVVARQRELRSRLARLTSSSALAPYAGREGALRRAWPDLTTSERRNLLLAGLGQLVVEPAGHRARGYDLTRVRAAKDQGMGLELEREAG